MISLALNPIALAAATLSLGAHTAVVGVLLFNSAGEPAEVVHRVKIVAVPALTSPPKDWQEAEPSALSEAPKLLSQEKVAEPRTTPAREVMPAHPATTRSAPHGDTPEPAALVMPRTKPVAQVPDPKPISNAESQEVASLDPAATRRSPPPSSPTIETRIAIVPGNAQPDYPLIARKRGYEGQAVVRVQISEKGLVLSATVASSSGHKVLDRAARDAVTAWQFLPAIRDGHPAAGSIEVPIEFRLR